MLWLKIGSIVLSILMGLLTAGNAASVGVNAVSSGEVDGLGTVAATGAATVGFGLLSWLPYLLSLFGIGGGGNLPGSIQAMVSAIAAVSKNLRDPVAWRNVGLAAMDLFADLIGQFPSDNPTVLAFKDWIAQGRTLIHALFSDQPMASAALAGNYQAKPVVMGRAPTLGEVLAK